MIRKLLGAGAEPAELEKPEQPYLSISWWVESILNRMADERDRVEGRASRRPFRAESVCSRTMSEHLILKALLRCCVPLLHAGLSDRLACVTCVVALVF